MASTQELDTVSTKIQRIAELAKCHPERSFVSLSRSHRPALSYREEGTPQGGVISSILANLYLHYTTCSILGSRWKSGRVKGDTGHPLKRRYRTPVKYSVGYIVMDPERLRPAMEKITQAILITAGFSSSSNIVPIAMKEYAR
jgi:hypothetical protein